jgi:hypothetical protein
MRKPDDQSKCRAQLHAIGPFLLLPKLQTVKLSLQPSPATKPCKSTYMRDEGCKPRHAEHKKDIVNPQNSFIIFVHNKAGNNLSSAKLTEEVENFTHHVATRSRRSKMR